MEHRIVDDPARGVSLEVIIDGDGPGVILLPAAMRGAEDFGALQDALTEAGYMSVAVNPRGAAGSRGPLDDITLRDLVDDVAGVIAALCGGRAHLIGHTLGNMTVRAAASYLPQMVNTVTVMPCGGGPDKQSYTIPSEVATAFGRSYDQTLTIDERLSAIRLALFAPNNDASPWLEGWWPATSALAAAAGRTNSEEWRWSGTAPMLIMQGLDDAMVPADIGRRAAAAFGDRATYIELANCGHAMLPEQPEAVAEHIIDFLQAFNLD